MIWACTVNNAYTQAEEQKFDLELKLPYHAASSALSSLFLGQSNKNIISVSLRRNQEKTS